MSLNYVRESLGAFAQQFTLPFVCSNAFGRLPLLYFLAMRTGQTTKSATTIGRPGMQTILAGVPLSKAKQEVFGAARIFIDIHTLDPSTADSDSKEMGTRDTRPTGTAEENIAQAEFRRFRYETPIKISHYALKQASEMQGLGQADRAVKNLTKFKTDEALQKHFTGLAKRFWFGGVINPTDSTDYTFKQNELQWKRPLGLLAALNTDNYYGRINRANLASGTAWKGKRVTATMAPDIFELINEANIGQHCADSAVGDGMCTLALCTATQFRIYKRQARKEGMKYWDQGVPDMAELGFRREVIQVDNTYVTYDPLCPAGYCALLNLGTWVYATDKTDNSRVTSFASMCENGQVGGEEADQAHVITEGSLICTAPYANCLFTAVSET